MGSVTPGLVCAHHHLYSALARGMPAPPATPTTFREVLELVWWRLDVALDLDLIRWSAMLGALEALECGTTAIIDHHESPTAIEGSLDVIAAACAEVGVRASCAYGVTDRHGAAGAAAGLAENERYLRSGGRGMVGVHAAFTCSDATLDAAAGLAADLGVGVHIHVAEGPDDAEAAERLAALSRDDWLIVHGVHLSADHPDTAWRWVEQGWALMPDARDDEVTWSYDAVDDPWSAAFTPGVRPTRVVVGGETVFDHGQATRVDAVEVRARAAEAAQRLFARL